MDSYGLGVSLLESRVSQVPVVSFPTDQSVTKACCVRTTTPHTAHTRGGGQTRRSLLIAVFAALFFGLFIGNLYQGPLFDSTKPMIHLRLVAFDFFKNKRNLLATLLALLN